MRATMCCSGSFTSLRQADRTASYKAVPPPCGSLASPLESWMGLSVRFCVITGFSAKPSTNPVSRLGCRIFSKNVPAALFSNLKRGCTESLVSTMRPMRRGRSRWV